MAGHSHWARIKRKKAVVDSRRGRLWSKLGKGITVAARLGGGELDANPRLRLAIDKARGANMPKDTIEKAIKKGTGELAGEALEEIIYEGYGPGGAAILCQVLTDNRNRTAPEIKKLLERAGGNLGSTNCVAWMFQQKGVVNVDAALTTEDALMEAVLDAGADDVKQVGGVFEVTCEASRFEAVVSALETAGIPTLSAELSMVPSATVTLDAQAGRRILRLMEELDDHEDVQNVYSNFDIPDAVMAELETG
jgi:YebC/PmpR family DNA-binding regulatory protein